jgi:hypothetical protein
VRVPGWLVAVAAVWSTVGMGVLDTLLPLRPKRRRVREVWEQETARHVPDLVPEQRTPEQPWWEFVPRQRGDNHDR